MHRCGAVDRGAREMPRSNPRPRPATRGALETSVPPGVHGVGRRREAASSGAPGVALRSDELLEWRRVGDGLQYTARRTFMACSTRSSCLASRDRITDALRADAARARA